MFSHYLRTTCRSSSSYLDPLRAQRTHSEVQVTKSLQSSTTCTSLSCELCYVSTDSQRCDSCVLTRKSTARIKHRVHDMVRTCVCKSNNSMLLFACCQLILLWCAAYTIYEAVPHTVEGWKDVSGLMSNRTFIDLGLSLMVRQHYTRTNDTGNLRSLHDLITHVPGPMAHAHFLLPIPSPAPVLRQHPSHICFQ